VRNKLSAFFLFFLLSLSLSAQSPLGPFTMSANFAADLYGNLDTRPGTWGFADLAQWTITFKPPAGYRVHILRIHGDLVSWIKTLPGDAKTPDESTAGVLLGIQSTPHNTNSDRCDFCADLVLKPLQTTSRKAPVQGTTMLYIQDSVSERRPNSRAQFDLQNINDILESDNKLLVTVSSWLNTTLKPVHIEPTFTVLYEWVQ
jgi:hypothetical protein